MRLIIKALFVAALLIGAYLYFHPGASLSDFSHLTKLFSKEQKIDPETGRPLIKCPRCKGTGVALCAARGCVDGKVECSGPCLKLSQGKWFKDEKLGHGPDELWTSFPTKNGGIQYVSQAHVGEVVESKNGNFALLGRCQICDGTTRVICKLCNGTSRITCPQCQGRREVPVPEASDMEAANATSGTVAAPPPVETKLELIRLKNGKTISGKIVIRSRDYVVIRTANGKSVELKSKELASP